MFRTYQVFFARLLQASDALIILGSFLLAWYLKFNSGLLPYAGHYPFHNYFTMMVFGTPVFLVSNYLSGLYRTRRIASVWAEAIAVLKGAAIGLAVFMSGLYFLHIEHFSRDVIVIFAILYVCLTLIERLALRLWLRLMRARGFNQRYILVIGWNRAAERFVHALENQPWFGYRVFGYLSDGSVNSDDLNGLGIPKVGSVGQFDDVLARNMIDQVVIALPRANFGATSHIISSCELLGVQSLILPDYFDLLPARPRFETFGDIPLIDTRYVPLDDAVNAAMKRGFDICVSLIALVLLSPVMLIIATAVKVSSPGSVIYSQIRVGKNRRLFRMYKFRTMSEPSSNVGGWTVKDDPRRTSLGRLLRKTSLDELPQFWNVLKGDMSVIGPRPEQPHFVEQFRDEIPKYMVKHRVRPGITGWAQVNGWRGDTSISERVAYDIDYIENWSLWLDLKIMGKTFTKGFVHPHAY